MPNAETDREVRAQRKTFATEATTISAAKVYRSAVEIFNGMDGGEMSVEANPCAQAVHIALKIRDELIQQTSPRAWDMIKAERGAPP